MMIPVLIVYAVAAGYGISDKFNGMRPVFRGADTLSALQLNRPDCHSGHRRLRKLDNAHAHRLHLFAVRHHYGLKL